MLFLLDRRGGLHQLPHEDGDTLAQTLLRYAIPPTSVLAFRNCDEVVLSDDTRLDSDTTCTARLIEGYDIHGIRSAFTAPESPSTANSIAGASHSLLHRRLSIGETGTLALEQNPLSGGTVAEHVESVVHTTLDHFNLAPKDSRVVLGLSGGVDSGSLLMLLAGYRDAHPEHPPNIVAGTFKDFDSKYSQTFDSAARLAERFGVEHHIIPAESAEEVFHLTEPIAQILMRLMETSDAHLAMYVDHHTTRRVLEVFADRHDATRIALGLHATDLLAGMINSWSSGHDAGPMPERQVGPYTYIMPLYVVPKRELHLYYTIRTGSIPNQTIPNQWEFNPTDRNFYYYLADHLQWLWPGMQHWVLNSHSVRAAAHPTFNTCANCGGSARVLATAPEWSGRCDVCELLGKHGYIHGRR